MRILSFDTSSSELHLSLLSDRDPILEREFVPTSGERQEVASILMAEIAVAFKDAGWKQSDVEAVVVGVGPGSFTGIRIAVITARTICQIFRVPLVGVSLLECLYTACDSADPAAIVLGSTSAQFFFGGYERLSSGGVGTVVQPSCGSAEIAEAQLAGLQDWFLDDKAASAFSHRSAKPLPKLKNVGTIQAQVAIDRLSLNGFSVETFAWQNVLPLYLRSPSVTIKKSYAAPNPAHES